MSRKSAKQKVEERFKQIQADRKHEESSLRFDERRDFEALPKEESNGRN